VAVTASGARTNLFPLIEAAVPVSSFREVRPRRPGSFGSPGAVATFSCRIAVSSVGVVRRAGLLRHAGLLR
jgi:hypothetical protein